LDDDQTADPKPPRAGVHHPHDLAIGEHRDRSRTEEVDAHVESGPGGFATEDSLVARAQSDAADRPGTTAKLVVTFKKKGKYPYLCTVPGHAAAGMKGTFTVR
jgi:uncharacterized cupredoxin-like copper-binding protein